MLLKSILLCGIVVAVLVLANYASARRLGNINRCKGQYWCAANKTLSRTRVVIDRTKVCNGRGDCPGSDDELDCPCRPLPTPLNGRVTYTGDSRYTLTAHFTCDARFVLKGNTSRTCRAPGQWSGVNPTCNDVGCGTLAPPLNGNVSFPDGMKFMSTAVFTCNEGYTNKLGKTAMCMANGKWQQSCPHCELNSCAILPKDPHGCFNALNTPIVVGTVAVLECDPGYIVNAAVMIRCLSNGTWESPSATCSLRPCVSIPQTDGKGKFISTDAVPKFGSVAVLKCEQCYSVDPCKGTIKCLEDGTWSTPADTCKIICKGDISTTVSCSTNSNAAVTCAVPAASVVIDPISLVTQNSVDPNRCVETWSYRYIPLTSNIEVTRNCDGVFQVCACKNSAQITCSSQNWQDAFCAAPGKVIHVEVINKLSTSACREKVGFGINGTNIYAKQGCRANFLVCYEAP